MTIDLPRALTFDCWNTLLYEDDWTTAHGLRVDALARAAERAGRAAERAVVGRAFDSAWERHMELWEAGAASGATEIAHWALAELGISPHGEIFPELLREFEEASHSGDVRAVDGSCETLHALSAAGVRLGLICDTGLTPGRVVRRHLDRLGLLDLLETQVFSDEWSLPKPHPEVFHAALTELGAAPAEAAHVGDLKRTDVAGARGVGMTSIRLLSRYDDRSAHAEADHVVRDYAALRALLGLDANAAQEAPPLQSR